MLHLWTHTQNRPVRIAHFSIYALSNFFKFIFLHCIFSFLLSLYPKHQASRTSTLSGRLDRSYTTSNFRTDRNPDHPGLVINSEKKIRGNVHQSRIGPGRLVLCLSASSPLWLFMTVIVSLCSCCVLSVADAAPLNLPGKVPQSRKDEINLRQHDSLTLTGIRPPTRKVLMPPYDLGFKGQTGSDSRKPSRSADASGYQSDAASNDQWSAHSLSLSGAGKHQSFPNPGAQHAERKDGRKLYHKQGKKRANSYGNPSSQVNRQASAYSNDVPTYENSWNPYKYPPKGDKAPSSPTSSSSSVSYYSSYQNNPNGQVYSAQANPAGAAPPYGPPINQGSFPDSQHPVGPYQHPYIPWENPNYLNPGPMQPGPNQPMIAPYPYVQYDVGGRGIGETYNQWEAPASYYQPAAQTYWNPYTVPQPGWFVAQTPVLQPGGPIQFVPSNLPRPAEMRPTSVIGHPSNYREISREEMNQRVREYEQARQAGENDGTDHQLRPLPNDNLGQQNQDSNNPNAQTHDNDMVLTGNTAHDQVVRNFLGIASEWMVIGVDALFDEIDLNGKSS
ncbi:hypothetical protein FBUS_00004 [Fasciolopsis buskii]|uniref:Uncharacterized protein n=1 Tax=Fasciolopsis buskii TaxID=27845 RepID=A0A8E0S4E8_9TREM|nr:hypothetical protein FBUS_00004 [Fasciolopsis buski]